MSGTIHVGANLKLHHVVCRSFASLCMRYVFVDICSARPFGVAKATHGPLAKKIGCPQCEWRFSRKPNLESYMKVHQNKSEQVGNQALSGSALTWSSVHQLAKLNCTGEELYRRIRKTLQTQQTCFLAVKTFQHQAQGS